MLKDLVRGRGVKIMVLWAPGQGLFKEAWVDVCGIFYLCLLLSDPFPLSFLRWFGIRLRSWLRDKSWNLTVFSRKTEPPVVQSWTLHLKCCRIGSVRGFHWSSIHLIGPKNESLRLSSCCNLWFPPKNDLYALGLYKPDLSSRPNMIMILTRSISITLIKDEAKSLPWRNIKSTLIWFYLQLEFS